MFYFEQLFRTALSGIDAANIIPTVLQIANVELRQETARLAHDNAIRKRNGMLASQLRSDINNLLKRR